jgi:putative Mn2+ efflux pump MntP
VAGALIIAAGLWLWYHASKGDDDEAKQIQRAVNHAGWALIVIALTVSLDELAIGFSFGLLRLPIIPALVVIASQAALMSLVGQWIGLRLGDTIGEYAERLVGPALCLLGLWFIVAQLAGLPA